jgi:hypothetical protein
MRVILEHHLETARQHSPLLMRHLLLTNQKLALTMMWSIVPP